MPKPSIFISYRIDDSHTEARLLFAGLSDYFGPNSTFLDKKRLDPGMDWPEELETGVRNAKVLLVLIKDGDKWLGVGKYGARRIDDEKDWVRKEIDTALTGNKIIIPVLLNGALIPPVEYLPKSVRKLPRKQAAGITTEKWDSDIAELVKTLEKHLPPPQPTILRADRLAGYEIPDSEEFDPLPHHPAPYLGLRYFDRHAARLFFGRTRELLDFFGLIENPEVRLICLYGYSGVGKSSFLAAGVRPRLESLRPVRYERRNKIEGFHNQLRKLLATTIGEKPVFILDQVEEMFTDLIPGEPDHFARTLAEAIRAEPKATFVLGFRSDFLLQMSNLLAHVDCARHDLPLGLLDQQALREAIESAHLDPTLKSRYAFDLEPGFAAHVANDLNRSESVGAASILQNRLLKLFNEAKKRCTNAAPVANLRVEDYEALNRSATAEEELFDFQIQRLRDEFLYDGDEQAVLKTLIEFVIPRPTARTVSKAELASEHTQLRDHLRRVSLLTEISEHEALRLSHDLLAPIVQRRYEQTLLNETERLEIETVRLRLKNVREYLLNLNFIEALEEFKPASLRNILPEEVWPVAFELAFAFLQAEKREDGVYTLLTCINYLHFAEKITPPFPDKTFPDNRDCRALLDFLRRCEPALFIRMEQRYFPVMRAIPGGKFNMGDVMGDNEYHDETVHPVELSAFELAETPVTWQQYGLFCLATGRELPNDSGFGRADRPVINVSWYEAVVYLNWLNTRKNLDDAITGEGENDETYTLNLNATGYRLPTEAEWEYAAREGGERVRFGNGKDIADPVEINFNATEAYKKDYSNVGLYRAKTTPVRHFQANALGLHDMSGNVYDWCWDWYGDYPSTAQTNPTGPDSGSDRVMRGGSWVYDAGICRVSNRDWYGPDYRFGDVGFRPARTVTL